MIDEVSINLTNFPTVTRFSSHMKKISESEVSILKKRKKSGKSFSEVSNSDHEHPGSRQHHRADNSSESLKFRSKTMLSAAADDDADDFVDSSQPPPKKKKKKKKQQQSDDEENHVKGKNYNERKMCLQNFYLLLTHFHI